MLYLSPTLTMLMLAVVPPVSLGAVSFLLGTIDALLLTGPPGLLWTLSQEALEQDARSFR
jgi:hypothetical protein